VLLVLVGLYQRGWIHSWTTVTLVKSTVRHCVSCVASRVILAAAKKEAQSLVGFAEMY
jgi:hypothetical protein